MKLENMIYNMKIKSTKTLMEGVLQVDGTKMVDL